MTEACFIANRDTTSKPGTDTSWQLAVKQRKGRAMTLDEASFDIARWLVELAQAEGRLPRITGIHALCALAMAEVSIWLDLDDPNANEGNGIVLCRVDECAVLGMGQLISCEH